MDRFPGTKRATTAQKYIDNGGKGFDAVGQKSSSGTTSTQTQSQTTASQDTGGTEAGQTGNGDNAEGTSGEDGQ